MDTPALWYPIVSGVVVALIALLAQYFIDPHRSQRQLTMEEKWRAKKEAFTAALTSIHQAMTASNWTGPDIPKDYRPSGSFPSALEVNHVYALLMLTATNPEIPKQFIRFHGAEPGDQSRISTQSRGEFIILLRKELFGEKSSTEADEIMWKFQ